MTETEIRTRRAIIERLQNSYDAVSNFPENDPRAMMKFIELRNAVPDALTELGRDVPKRKHNPEIEPTLLDWRNSRSG